MNETTNVSPQLPENQTITQPEAENMPPKDTKNKKKKMLIVLLAIVLITSAAAYFMFMKKDVKTDTADSSVQPNSQVEETISATPKSPDMVAYAFKEDGNDPYSFYTRPTAGGDRVAATGVKPNDYVYTSDVHGNNVAFVTEPTADTPVSIWLSKDGGRSYDQVFEGTKATDDSSGDQVTSLIFSTDGSKLIFGKLQDNRKNAVTTINVADAKTDVLFESEKAGIFLEGFNATSGEVLYFEGCFNCDGTIRSALMYWDKDGASKTLVEGNFHNIAVRNDFKELVAIDGTLGDNDGGFSSVGTPFTYVRVAIPTGEKTELAKTSNDYAFAGYLNDNETIYYTDKNKVIEDKDKPSTVYESSGTLFGVDFVSDENVIVRTGAEPQNFTLNNYDVAEKNTTKILSADVNTVIFGISTK